MFGFFKKKPAGVREILIPASAIADDAAVYAPVSAVVDFVNAVLHRGHYRRWEIPQAALDAYHADYYYAQVCNGGHSQFIRNSGMPDATLDDAEAGLAAMGATEMLACLREMRAWAREHIGEAMIQDGFETRAEALDTLDQRLYAADEDSGYHKAANRWLQGLSEIRVVPDAQWSTEVEAVIAANPNYRRRADDALIGRLGGELTDPFRTGLAFAGLISDPKHMVQGLTAGSFVTIDGEQTLLWGVRTDQGICQAIQLQDAVFLLQPEDGNYLQPGKALSRAPTETIEQAIAHANSHAPSFAAIVLLRRAGIEIGVDCMAFATPVTQDALGEDVAAYELGLEDGRWLVFAMGTKGAAFAQGDHMPQAEFISANEISIERRAYEQRLAEDKKQLAASRRKA